MTKNEINTTIILTRQDKTCPECGYMIHYYLNKGKIWTLQGPLQPSKNTDTRATIRRIGRQACILDFQNTNAR